MDAARQLRNVVRYNIVQPTNLLFLGGVFLQDVVDGPEGELGGPVGRLLPQLSRLLRPMCLLRWVVDVADCLGPGVGEAVGEVPVLIELVPQLGVDLPDEPGLVFAGVWVVSALALPVVDVLLMGEME